MKTCTRCNISKPLDEFTKGKARCKKCCTEISLEWYHKKMRDSSYRKSRAKAKMKAYWKDRDRINDMRAKKRLERDYNITYDEWINLLEKQDNQCAICKDTIEWQSPDGKYRACVDHCHINGNIRGLLCPRCNQALGLFRDDPEIMQRAITYLQQSQS